MNTVNNAIYKKSLLIGAPKWKQVLWYATNLLLFQNPLVPFSGIRVMVLRSFGAKVGKGVVIKPSVRIKFPWKLIIGDHSWIGERVWIDNLDEVKIGESVCISQGSSLLTGNHNFKQPAFDLMVAPIQLEDGVWIGAQAVVCPGVTCATHAVLTVASIASKNLLPYGIYKGNPAVKMATRTILNANIGIPNP